MINFDFTRSLDLLYDRIKQAMLLESDRAHVLREMMQLRVLLSMPLK